MLAVFVMRTGLNSVTCSRVRRRSWRRTREDAEGVVNAEMTNNTSNVGTTTPAGVAASVAAAARLNDNLNVPHLIHSCFMYVSSMSVKLYNINSHLQ